MMGWREWEWNGMAGEALMRNTRSLQGETLVRQSDSDAAYNGSPSRVGDGRGVSYVEAYVPTSVDTSLMAVAQSSDMAQVEAAFIACLDQAERFARVEQLKARIASGTYTMDSKTLAQTLQQDPFVQNVLRYHDAEEANTSR